MRNWLIVVAVVSLLVVGSIVWSVVSALMRASKREEKERAEAAAVTRQWEAGLVAWEQARGQARWNDLCGRFGPDIGGRIFRGEHWQGQTTEQLVLSIGRPADIDESVKRTKTTHVFKYHPNGIGRYNLRITLDDGIVVGWDA